MKIKEKNIDDQLHLLKSISYIIPSLTMLVGMIKIFVNPYLLFLIFLSGVQLSWKFHFKGLCVSIGLCILVIGYRLMDQDLSSGLLTVGFSISMILSLIIVYLSMQESKELVNNIESESKSRLNNLIQLDEKQQKTVEQFNKEKENLMHQIQEHNHTISILNEKIESSTKLNRAIQNELEVHINECNHYKSQAISLNNTIQINENEILKLKEHTSTLESLLEFSEEEKNENEKKYLLKNEEFIKWKEEKTHLENLLNTQQEEIIHLQNSLKDVENYRNLEKAKSENMTSEVEEKLLVYEKLLQESNAENKKLEEDLKKAKTKVSKKQSSHESEKKYNDLLIHFKEKSEELDETRNALFRMQEKLFTLQRENEEKRKQEKNELKTNFEKLLEKKEEEMNLLINSYQLKIEDLEGIKTPKHASN